MTRGLLVLLICQLGGELVASAFRLPIPGAVLGMAALFGFLTWRGGTGRELEATACGLLRHLGLLFVPAGVGIITLFDRLRGHGPALAITLVLSTLATLLVTGWILQRLLRNASARRLPGDSSNPHTLDLRSTKGRNCC